MTGQSLPDGKSGEVPPLVGNPQARLVVGGLTSAQRTLALILEQARLLESLDLIDPPEMQRLQELAAETENLMNHYREGRFLGALKALVDQMDRR